MVGIILSKIASEFTGILGDNLVGIYMHGSIAFGCFRFDTSDIDFIAVVRSEPALEQKIKLIEFLLEITPEAPLKGIEMSVILREDCVNFKYPTPYLLHFSNTHLDKYKADLAGICESFHGLDYDLAAHFTVILKTGIALCGDEIADVFGEVPYDCYLDSIIRDITEAGNDIISSPVHIILNLCRVLAAVSGRLVLSKEQGGLWALDNTDARYAPLIDGALDCYLHGGKLSLDESAAKDFAEYMKSHIMSYVIQS